MTTTHTTRSTRIAPDAFTPDLIVIGAGSAGLPVAISAAGAGAKVLVIEKTERIGGTLYRTGGNISAAGTKRQRERGIEDSVDAHYQDVLRIAHGRNNAELTRLAVEQAPIMADWLDDNGFEFDPATPAITWSHEPYTTPRTFWGVEPGLSVLAVLKRLLQPHLDSGQIRLLLSTRAERLVTEHGHVAGVVAGGAEYRANHVVLTSGGFTSNPDIFEQYSGGYRPLSSGMPDSTGDGLKLALEVGASTHNSGVFLPTIAGFADEDTPGQIFVDPLNRIVVPSLIPQLRAPWEVWLDEGGNRFLREDEPDIEVREEAIKAKGLSFWVVFDDRIVRDAPQWSRFWTADELRAEAARGKLLLRAESLPELADGMGIPAANLTASIASYNRAIESGAPDPLGREHRPLTLVEPPFYAAHLHAYTNLSWAGLRVNAELAVLRADDTPIGGLFAVGEILGFSTFSGHAHVGGMSLGPAISLGRYLGHRLGERVAASRA